MSRGRLHAVLVVLALALIGAGTAYAHQIAVNNGVAVTLHVALTTSRSRVSRP